MKKFVATTESTQLPELVEIRQRFCDEQWVADHLNDEQDAATVLDQFKRTIEGELKAPRDSMRR
jgi:hypothetical protein